MTERDNCNMGDAMKKLLLILVIGSLVLFETHSAIAQEMEFGAIALPDVEKSRDIIPPKFHLALDSSYTGAGKATFSDRDVGNIDAYNVSLRLGSVIPLNDRWSIPLELMSQNIYLDAHGGAPIPDDIHTLQLGTGLGYRFNNRWMFTARVTPTLYKIDSIGSNDVGISGGITAMWRYSPTMKWMFGLMYSPDSDLAKVMPMAGFDWDINRQLNLRMMFPAPRLTYSLDNRWRLYAGANMNMATFRTDNHLGTDIGQPQYNNALASYRDIRMGVGVGYHLSESISAETEAGYSLYRRINYTDVGGAVDLDPSAYVRFGLVLRY